LEKVEGRKGHRWVKTGAVEGIGDKMIQPRGWCGGRRRRGRGDIRASKEMGNEATTQFGCVLVSMIRVTPTGTLSYDERGEREKLG